MGLGGGTGAGGGDGADGDDGAFQRLPVCDNVQAAVRPGRERLAVHRAGLAGLDSSGRVDSVSDGTLVETSLDYIQSDNPLPVDTPRLGGEKK